MTIYRISILSFVKSVNNIYDKKLLTGVNGYGNLDQTRPDQTRPDQTRPDQTRPDHNILLNNILIL